ncbi:MAG TPA: tetratricopeptide repeat protein [Thermoanaerobaculia bacterium]|nr:tetratricopeptide repeat protein [Thermoanaerobaculia bacterium]
MTVETYEKRLGGEKERAAIGGKVLGVSFSLLTDAFRERYRHLAVFAGDFDAPAAGAVWGLGEDETDETLGAFVRGSLIEGTDGRYKLHDLSRAFAASRLAEEEKTRGEVRHAEHYCGVLREADRLYEKGNEHVLAGLALFDRERHQIAAGQAWATEQLQLREEAARLASDYQTAGVQVLGLRQPPRQLINWLEAGREGARRTQDREAEGRHLGNLGIAYAKLGETRRAIEIYHQALAIAREIGDRRSEGNALGCLGLAYGDLGKFRRAIEYHEQYLAISREIGSQRGEGNALGNLGNAHRGLGETRRAIEYYEQQLIIAREIGDRRGEASVFGGLGLACADLGEIRRAVEYHEQHLAIDREIGDRLGEGVALGNLGLAYADLGETRCAIEHYEQQLAITREIGDRRGEGIASWNLGEAYEKLGELARAVEPMQFCVDFLQELNHPDAEKHAAELEAIRARLEGR